MKFGIASDLHHEHRKESANWIPDLPKRLDAILLAGDLGNGAEVINLVNRIAEEHRDSIVIWVAGNHEYYNQEYEALLAQYRTTYAHNLRIHFLEEDYIQLGKFRVFGCTLWTGFNSLTDNRIESAMEIANRCIRDFKSIRHGKNKRTFSPEACRALFLQSYEWLNTQLARHPAEHSIVMTHFPPARELRHQNIRENELSAYFQANCVDLLKQHRPALWVYGHNHWTHDTRIYHTRCVSNQLGYPQEEGKIPEFNPVKIIELK